ncbi:hypothetical protein EVAR_68754_1 [Eumeta japonica]|uniref:Uncharacterized protein n=1 Tax=Eumeta variegata TaxID=151549 RepID=A0A4C2A113_EUMVA|nr:hypothetical protein EVAR_68754_1 [Eumeta japonica]
MTRYRTSAVRPQAAAGVHALRPDLALILLFIIRFVILRISSFVPHICQLSQEPVNDDVFVALAHANRT